MVLLAWLWISSCITFADFKSMLALNSTWTSSVFFFFRMHFDCKVKLMHSASSTFARNEPMSLALLYLNYRKPGLLLDQFWSRNRGQMQQTRDKTTHTRAVNSQVMSNQHTPGARTQPKPTRAHKLLMEHDFVQIWQTIRKSSTIEQRGNWMSLFPCGKVSFILNLTIQKDLDQLINMDHTNIDKIWLVDNSTIWQHVLFNAPVK